MNQEKLKDIKYYAKIGITLLLISSLTAALLAFVNSVTKDKIAENELAVMENALEEMFDGCDSIKKIDKDFESPVNAVYEVYKAEEKIGYGVQVSPVGFKDSIGIIVGRDNDGKCVGVEITSISDTPGVGTKVKDSAYLGGYIGVDKDSSSEVELISGATISSSAVREGIIKALSISVEYVEDTADSIVTEDTSPEDTSPENATPEDTATPDSDANAETESAPTEDTSAETEAENGGVEG